MTSIATSNTGDEGYLSTLNPPQLEAVEHGEGPLLVLAGAGTGKTRVLITRLAYLLKTGQAHPKEILAVTFTNKAAREMRMRLAKLIGPMAESLWIGTFHSVAVRFLRIHAERIGLQQNFTILDDDDQKRLIKQLLEFHDIDTKKNPPRLIQSIIQRWKDRAMTPDKVHLSDVGTVADGKMLQLYTDYQERLKTLNAADFGDLILHNLTLFREHPDVARQYQEQFQYLLVDEYQDTNVAQYLWLRLLTQVHKNICCVGDDDQSIYGWRGAEVGNILKFEKDFEGAKTIRLEQNYRSTPYILQAASYLISHNKERLGKELWTAEEDGEKVMLRGVWDGPEEARFVSDIIENLYVKKHSLNEIAVLVRAGFQTREFEERLLTMGIPYRVIGGARFYERMEIRDAMAYFRVIAQPEDSLAFERIMNTPKRGLGDAVAKKLHEISRHQNISLYRAATRLIQTEELRPQARKSLTRLMQDFERWREMVDGYSHTELAEIVLDESGYTTMWQNHKGPDGPGRLENLKELIHAMEDFENLGGFLEHVSLVMENITNDVDDQVSLMTLHSAKGLEFDTVFLPGWEEGLFPSQRTLDGDGEKGLEEERRLAFVGITRARERAVISYAANRRIHNQWHNALPSRFISELPQEALEDMGGTVSHGAHSYQQQAQSFNQTPQMKTISSSSKFSQGERVFHQKFGYGCVTGIDGDKLTVNFEHSGVKKIIERFVEAV